MKKEAYLNYFILIGILLALPFAIAVDISPSSTATTLTDSNFVITGLKYEPYPVLPGEQFDLWVKVENKGIYDIPNATCILKPGYPFSIYQGESIKSYGMLDSGDSVVFKFNLKVDENSVQGSNNLDIWCAKDPSTNAWKVEKVNIFVQTRYPTLNIKEIRTDPSVISPGKDAQLLFTLENLADSPMKDIDIILNLSGADIAPSGEVAEKKLRILNSGNVSDVMFNIKAMPGTKGGIYKVQFSMAYTDNLGTPYSQSGIIAIEVSSKPQLIISIDSATVSKSGRIGDVDIKIVNSGLTDLKFFSVEIMPSESFKPLSSNVVYIGDIDSDDFGTASFKLSAKTGNDFNIPLKLSFRDALNNDYSENINVNFRMLSDSELGKKSQAGMIIVLIVIIVLLFIFIRRLREKVFGLLNIFKKK